jgi:hypothetical protein
VFHPFSGLAGKPSSPAPMFCDICGAAVRNRIFVWRCGEEFERLIWSLILGFERLISNN